MNDNGKSDLNIHVPFEGTHLEEVLEQAGQLCNDQAEWIDMAMKKIMSDDDYKACISNAVSDEEKAKIIQGKYKLYMENVANTGGLRLWHNDPFGKGMTFLGEFKPSLQVEDGQKIYFIKPTEDDPDPYGDSLYPGKPIDN